MSGILYIVATPIGNLEDITLRALRVLKEADMVLAEDTRVTKKLLFHYHIEKPLLSYRQHSGEGVVEKILKLLREGRRLALVTDAGTPGIEDPGNKLVEEVIKRLGDGVNVVVTPGASALTALASVAGISMDRFCFLGYPPAKKGRKRFFEEMAHGSHATILYESPHRILRTLEDIRAIVENERYIVIGRELTKKFETIYRGSVEKILAQLVSQKPQGEYTIIVGAEKGKGRRAAN